MQTINGKDMPVGRHKSNSRVGYHITGGHTPEMESFCSISQDDETRGWAADIREFYKPGGGMDDFL